MEKIYINFINSDGNLLNIFGQLILIQVISDSGLNIFTKDYVIQYYLDNNINKKIYYIETNDLDISQLKTSNFIFNLPVGVNFIYGWYKNEAIKSIIIFASYNYLPLIYMGLPNITSQFDVQINYQYKSILNDAWTSSNDFTYNDPSFYDGSGNLLQTLFNNYDGNFNYLVNKIQIPGYIYQIYISDNSGIIGLDSSDVYKLFKIPNQLNLTTNTNIYFYKESNLFSSILYLNNYNFVDYKKFSNEYESIILYIEYIETPGGIYSTTDLSDNLIPNNYPCDSDCFEFNQKPFFYKYDESGNVIPVDLDINTNPSYISIQSLNLQTFNSSQLASSNEDEYYKTLFFYNYINSNYFVKSIKMFCYDFKKYFVNYSPETNPKKPPQLNNIGSFTCDLYEIIIESDSNLGIPVIMNLNYPWVFVNIDLLNLIKLIRFESVNNYFYNLTKSKKINLKVIVDYLSGFEIKKYNIYKIFNLDNNDNPNDLLDYKNSIRSTVFRLSSNNNYNYIYDNSNLINLYDIKDNNKFNRKINFNNGIMNCIRCKIIFFLSGYMGMYSFDAKLFLDNYNIQIYHKKYNFENNPNNQEKKKLINALVYLATMSVGIKVIFYNEKKSEPSASSIYNYYLNSNPYYFFNEINLSKANNEFSIYLDIIGEKNNYKNQFLKFNMYFNKNYYLLFLYADKGTPVGYFEELIFTFSQYTFKIFKIPNPNANLNEKKDLFYIGFNNLKDINIFMDYLEYGIFNPNKENLSNYFNFSKSKIFVNYYNINNLWVLDSVDSPVEISSLPNPINKYQIYFSINNLKVDQVFLYGDLSIKPYHNDTCPCENH